MSYHSLCCRLGHGEAAETAYEATSSETKVLSDASTILRQHIECKQINASPYQWPPSAYYLHSEASKPLQSLLDFLAIIISGKPLEQSTSRNQRLCSSFTQDICYAATRDRWTVSTAVLFNDLSRVIHCHCKVSARNTCGSNLCSCRHNGLNCLSACSDRHGNDCLNCEQER